MSEELNNQLTGLASKLGISVEHLWGVLVKQAYIDGISSLATTLVCVLLGVGVVYAFFYLRRKFKNTPPQEWTQPFGVLMEPFGFVILGIVLLAIITIGSDNLYWVISDFCNPEFYALRHLPFSK
jgi:succinate dehydrogenase hydrophobic anchor subunit